MAIPPPPPPIIFDDDLVDLMLYNGNRQPYERLDVLFNNFSNSKCFKLFRMKKNRILILAEMLAPHLIRRTQRHGALRPLEMVLAFLRVLAVGCDQQVVVNHYLYF